MTTLADTRILRRPEVLDRVGFSQSTLYRLMELGAFPRPVRISTRATGWRSDEVEEWLASRPHTVPESPRTNGGEQTDG